MVLCMLAFGWLGLRVYRAVDQLTILGHGISNAGAAVAAGFSVASNAIKGIPLVGGTLAGALSNAGLAASGNVQSVGQAGARSAHHVAQLLGILTWVLPTALLLLLVLPGRVRQVRRLGEARGALLATDTEERRRLMALRALVTLPDRQLLAQTPDPVGDLLAQRYDGLVAAALEDLGLRSPPSAP